MNADQRHLCVALCSTPPTLPCLLEKPVSTKVADGSEYDRDAEPDRVLLDCSERPAVNLSFIKKESLAVLGKLRNGAEAKSLISGPYTNPENYW